MVAEDEDADVVCVCLENVARLLKECGPMSIGAVSNCPEMVVNSVKGRYLNDVRIGRGVVAMQTK